MAGWIKLHRSLIEWEWYKDPNTARLFIHLLLRAQHKDTSHQGTQIMKGQLKTGRKSLSDGTGLSEQNIRTALNNLVSTGEITIKPTNKFSIITLVNWNTYQIEDNETNQQVTSQLTNNQPASNQQVTTCKNVKNKKNEEEYTPEFEEFWKLYPKRQGKKTGKPQAFSHFKKALKRTDVETLKAAIGSQSRTNEWTKNNGQFVPDAFRWLRDGKWEDEVDLAGVAQPIPIRAGKELQVLEDV